MTLGYNRQSNQVNDLILAEFRNDAHPRESQVITDPGIKEQGTPDQGSFSKCHNGARGGNRTRTTDWSTDFKSVVST